MEGSTLDENGSEFYFVEILIPATVSSEAAEVKERLFQEMKLEMKVLTYYREQESLLKSSFYRVRILETLKSNMQSSKNS